MSALLEVRDLQTAFPGRGGEESAGSAGDGMVPVVDGVSFDLTPGEVLALVGESGSGKSMTALSALRLVPKPGRVTAGRVLLGGEDLLGLPVSEMRRIRGGRISMIFQEPMTCLNPVVSVGKQVVEAIRLHENVSKADAIDRTRGLFGEVGIPDPGARLAAYPHELSGGLKQRIMIAMALSTRPEILIADEPTTALDVTVQAQILSLLRELQKNRRTAILLITHDLGIVNELADEIAVMYAGRLVETGPREAILADPQHPYTRGLLRSMPARTQPGERLHEIPGVVPSSGEWPKGCRFSTRCSERYAPCADVFPEPTLISETSLASTGGAPTHDASAGARAASTNTERRVWCHAVADGRPEGAAK